MQAVRRPTLSEARLESVLETAPDGIIVMDEGSRLLIFNKACEQLFGYQASEVIGENVSVLMPREHQDNHDLYVQRYRATGERKIIGIGREVEGRRKDGSIFPLDLSVGEALTPNGRQFIGVIRDLSARRETERRLAAVQADLIRMTRVSALDEMGSALAHELNQPLTAIMLYLQALEREVQRLQSAETKLEPRAVELLGKATREAQRAGSIISRVRQLVEKRAPERKRSDLNTVVDEALELAMLGRRRSIILERHGPETLPVVFVDPVQVQQVVLNLARNAIEACHDADRPTLTIKTWFESDSVCFSVSDNGPGIAPEQMQSLFSAFRSENGTGMGIGLTISRAIVQNHKGELLVDPGGNGHGARFTVRLPIAADEKVANRDSAAAMPLAAAAEPDKT
ncbi:MAG: PAS domain S-box protein [Beijerinckiaceae bacterium]|jgi:two-component system sensor kinase FixL|nr:PAS domain S-box protein [Beijerinckiaceae bacterium]